MSTNTKQISDFVKDLLIKEGFFKTELKDNAAEWRYVVEFPPGTEHFSEIFMPKGQNILIVATGVTLSEEVYKALISMPENKRKDLIFKWKKDLLFTKADFRMIPNDEYLQKIEFAVPIFPEKLSRAELIEALREIYKCKLYIIWSLQHEIGNKKSKDNCAMYV